MKPTDKFSYSFDGERYEGWFDSIEEALNEAREEVKDYPEGAEDVYIGRVYEYEPYVDAVRVIELVQYDAMVEADDAARFYLDNVKKEDWQKLEEMLTETFNKWAAETGNEPNFFTVEDVQEYSLEEMQWLG
ncbi:MAG: hypothetical protein ACI3WS_03725 [Phascolarctobacterium sp.]